MGTVSKRFIPPDLIERHFSTRLYQGYLNYLQKKLGAEAAKAIVSKTGLDWDYLNNESNWVSEKYADLFYDVLDEVDGIDKDFSYLAGKYAFSVETGGVPVLLGTLFLNIKSIFKQTLYFTDQFNKVDSVRLLSLNSNEMKFIYSCRRKTKHISKIIENWLGCVDAVPEVMGSSRGKSEFKMVDEFTFEITTRWENSNFVRYLRTSFGLLSLVTIGLFGLSVYFQSRQYMELGLCTLSCALGLIYFLEKKSSASFFKSKEKISALLKNSEDRYLELHENKVRLDRRYREANLLTRVIQRISQAKQISELVRTTVQEIKVSLEYDRVIYMAANPESDVLAVMDVEGFDPAFAPIIRKYKIDLKLVTPNEIHLGNVFRSGKSLLIPVTKDYIGTLSAEGRQLFEMSKSRSFLMCTVASPSQKYGVLLVDYAQTEKSLSNDDLHIVQNLSNQLAVCMDNLRYLSEERSLRLAFQRFVPQQVVESLTGKSRINFDHGVSHDVTIVFSDIREFTKKSTHLPPSVFIELINHYFQVMTEIIYRHGGIVDKFLGDGIMAVFNAFDENADHAQAAVNAAIEMREALIQINEWNASKTGTASGYQVFEFGVGIHSGPAILGNIGTRTKSEFTVLGETVNLAARLVGLSKEASTVMKNPILVSDDVRRRCQSEFIFQSLGVKSIRGFDHSLEIYLTLDKCAERKAA